MISNHPTESQPITYGIDKPESYASNAYPDASKSPFLPSWKEIGLAGHDSHETLSLDDIDAQDGSPSNLTLGVVDIKHESMEDDSEDILERLQNSLESLSQVNEARNVAIGNFKCLYISCFTQWCVSWLYV